MINKKILKQAAGWVYRNRHTGYWTSPILLPSVCPDAKIQALNLSLDDANAVFHTLEEILFLQPIEGDILAVGQLSFQKYRIRMSNLRAFRSYSEVPFYYFLPESAIYYLEKYWGLFLVCATLIVTSFLNGFVGKLGQWIGEKLTQ